MNIHFYYIIANLYFLCFKICPLSNSYLKYCDSLYHSLLAHPAPSNPSVITLLCLLVIKTVFMTNVTMEKSTQTLLLLLCLISVSHVYSQLDVSKSWRQGQQLSDWNDPQLNLFTGNKWWYHYCYEEGCEHGRALCHVKGPELHVFFNNITDQNINRKEIKKNSQIHAAGQSLHYMGLVFNSSLGCSHMSCTAQARMRSSEMSWP